jgi:O-antigen ligase
VLFLVIIGPARLQGGFTGSSWGAVTVILAAAAWLLSGGRAPRVGVLELLALGSFVLLAGWIALSLLWTPSVPLTVLELERSLVPVAALVALSAAEAGDRAEAAVLAVAMAAVTFAAWALLAGVDAPIGYANATAIVCLAGTIAVGGWALGRGAKAAAVAAPVVCLLVVAAYRTDSRGAWLALIGGVAVAVSLRSSRPRAASLASLFLAVAVAVGFALRDSAERVAYWRVAVAQAGNTPLVGEGAGTWKRTWLAERHADLAAQNAHSLYLEALSEIGAVGLALLAAGLLLPLLAAVRARREPLVPAAAGAYAAFLIHLAVDWDWQLTPALLCLMLLGGYLLVSAREHSAVRLPRGIWPAALPVLVLAGAVSWAGGYLVAEAQAELRSARWASAAHAARRAHRVEPWSSEPWRLLGEAQRAEGRVDEARVSFRRGLELDRTDVELWLALASVATGAELRLARARAAQLDPRGSRPRATG